MDVFQIKSQGSNKQKNKNEACSVCGFLYVLCLHVVALNGSLGCQCKGKLTHESTEIR